MSASPASSESTTELERLIAQLRSLVTQVGESASDLAKVFIASELTIRDHCDSLRQQVDIARETALENIHKASDTLITEIDAYERECLTSWRAAKESTEVNVKDVSERMSAFIAEQQAFLQRVQGRDEGELLAQLDLVNKLKQELSDRKKELTAAMFGDQLASFIAFPIMGDASLGELAFTSVQLPFETLDISSNELKTFDIRAADYDVLLPLEDGERIVAFQMFSEDYINCLTKMICFDRLGRSVRILSGQVNRENVCQSGASEFVVFSFADEPELSVYDSDLYCLRKVSCKPFSSICCSSMYVFGLRHTNDQNKPDADNDDNKDEQEDPYSIRRIQVLHLDTLSEAFELRVPKKFAIEWIMADEHHVVAMSCVNESGRRENSQWFISVFDLATCNENGSGDNTNASFFLAERHIDLAIRSVWLLEVFLLDGWLVVRPEDGKQLVWFDKNGQRNETSTDLATVGNLRAIYSSESSILFALRNHKLLIKRF